MMQIEIGKKKLERKFSEKQVSDWKNYVWKKSPK